MTAPQAARMAADAGTSHPDWCDSGNCNSLPNGPDIAPTLLHGGAVQSWRVDDARLKLRLVRTDDPPVGGPVGQPRVEMLVTSECRGFRDGDVILTVAEATDLVHRVQALLDVAARDGRRTMSQSQTAVPVPPVAVPASQPLCPPWCDPALHSDYSDYRVHHSGDRQWVVPGSDGLCFEVSFERYDELDAPYPHNIGQTSLAITVTSLPGAIGADGWLLADHARQLGAWLIAAAEEADPHGRNGEPIEWLLLAGITTPAPR